MQRAARRADAGAGARTHLLGHGADEIEPDILQLRPLAHTFAPHLAGGADSSSRDFIPGLQECTAAYYATARRLAAGERTAGIRLGGKTSGTSAAVSLLELLGAHSK